MQRWSRWLVRSTNLPISETLHAYLEWAAEHTKLEKWDENGKPYLEEYKGADKLKNKKVLVTGGDSGIGRSVASASLKPDTAVLQRSC